MSMKPAMSAAGLTGTTIPIISAAVLTMTMVMELMREWRTSRGRAAAVVMAMANPARRAIAAAVASAGSRAGSDLRAGQTARAGGF